MQAGNSRRLTGASWWLDAPGAAIEVVFAADEDPDALFASWCETVGAALKKLAPDAAKNWTAEFGRSGNAQFATWAFTAPVDQLAAATELAERSCVNSPDLTKFLTAMQAEQNPYLRAWIAHADAHGVPWLLDEEQLSLGMGTHSRSWPLSEVQETLPDLTGLGKIPHVLITGTNGKTTTARMVARILRAHGLLAGNTSTDGLMVDGKLVTPGDWTGPGGARQLLRNPQLQAAALETARGGLLRRGLVTKWADAAVVLNVSADHMEENGVNSARDMADAKLTVRKGLHPDGLLVVNAECAPLVEVVHKLGLAAGRHRLGTFAQNQAALSALPATVHAWVENAQLVLQDGPTRHAVVALDEIPLTFGGTAPHNVENALAALLCAHAMQIPLPTIAEGLRTFHSTIADNPGRANMMELNGATLLVDFAHNPDGVEQLARLVDRWPRQKCTVLIGQAGDRSDELMHDLVRATLLLRPDRVVIKDTDRYLRGRQTGEIPVVLERYYLEEGVPPSALCTTPDEQSGLAACLQDAHPGNLLILLVHDDFPAAIAQLEAAGAKET